MKDNTEIFHNILNRYNLIQPLRPDIQDFIIKSRRKNIKPVLKRTKRFGLIMYCAFMLGTVTRQLGKSLSLLQCKLIVSGLLIAGTGAIGVAGYYGGSYIYNSIKKDNRVETIDTRKMSSATATGQNKVNNTNDQHRQVSTGKPEKQEQNVKGTSTDAPAGSDITTIQVAFKPDVYENRNAVNRLQEQLIKHMNNYGEAGKRQYSLAGSQSDIIIVRSVALKNSMYTVLVQVIDARASSFVHIFKEKVRRLSDDEIDRAGKKIAKLIDEKFSGNP